MTTKALTKKQQTIIRLIYRYRFINTNQLQGLMQLQDKKRLKVWLKDLRTQHYVEWIYTTDFIGKTKPAIYYMGRGGVGFARGLQAYPKSELHKRYNEAARTPAFIAASLLLVDCALAVTTQASPQRRYALTTKADYADPQHTYHFLQALSPDLYYQRTEQTASGAVVTDYLVDIFAASLPRYMIRQRLSAYVTFLAEEDWQRSFDGSELMVHIACSSLLELRYAKQRSRLLMSHTEWRTNTHIRFTTIDQLRLHGVTGLIWEEA